MADYPIIADVSKFILETLRKNLCPEPIPSPNNIELSSPAAQNVDYLVGLYLYDIAENTEVSHPRNIQRGKAQLSKPPRPYDLYYMVFINGSAQMGLKDPDMHKIIGKIAQILNDHSSVSPNDLQHWLEVQEPPIALSQAKIGLEEKERVWRMVNKPYQICLFYKASPVYLSSGKVIKTHRVTDASFKIEIPGEEGG